MNRRIKDNHGTKILRLTRILRKSGSTPTLKSDYEDIGNFQILFPFT